MTDPILAALLQDPDPDARRVAADRAGDLGDELGEAALRIVSGWPYQPVSSFHPIVERVNRGGWPRVWVGAVVGEEVQTAHVWIEAHLPLGLIRCYDVNRGQWDQMPPPDLEAAVLAVLWARLAEVRQGVV